MNRETTNKKKRERFKLSKNRKSWLPTIQVDKNADPLSNFLNNLLRQFKNAKGLNLLGFFQRMKKEPNRISSESIIGATKTIISADLKKQNLHQHIYRNRFLKQENPKHSRNEELSKASKRKIPF